MVYFGGSFLAAMPPSSKKSLLIRVAYQVIDLISVSCKVFVDQVERIPAEEYGPVSYTHLTLPTKRIV